MWWQILIFAACHISGFKLINLVEFFSVALIGYTLTYVAVKSRALVAGMVYHYLHDSFLFFVQVPGAEYHGFADNVTFYSFLWAAMLINILIITLFTEKYGLKGQNGFFASAEVNDNCRLPFSNTRNSKTVDIIQRAILLLSGISSVLLIAEMIPSGVNFIFILVLFSVMLNIGAFIFYKKFGEKIFSIALIITGLCQLISGYQSYLGGSQRVFILTFLIGIVYILLGLFSHVLRKTYMSNN